MRSVEWMVDEHYVFYTPHPSHGTTTKMALPVGEDENTLHSIVAQFPNAKWLKTDKFWQEGKQRDYCVQTVFQGGADLIIWVDADEIWDEDVLSEAIDHVLSGDAAEWRVRAMHFWRSVNYVCMDEAMPIRFIKRDGHGIGYVPGMGFYHMGYAQSEMLILYKQSIHGHRAEWRRNWYGDIYKRWHSPEDTPPCGVHPTCSCDDDGKPFWVPRQFDKYDIEHLIGDHPYWDAGII